MEISQYLQRLEEIEAHGNKLFSIEFVRRNDKKVKGVVVEPAGTVRRMICRLGVTKGVQGVQQGREQRDINNRLVTVYEMAGDSSGFKCIPVDGIVSMSPVMP